MMSYCSVPPPRPQLNDDDVAATDVKQDWQLATTVHEYLFNVKVFDNHVTSAAKAMVRTTT